MRDLHDRVVVITGAGSGIGRATARVFAAEGAIVHVTDVDAAAVEATAAAIRDAGGRATAHEVDCTDGDATTALADAVLAAGGRVDVLHNNAGVCVGGPVEDIPLEDWRWAVDVNLWGVIHGIRAFLPAMIARREGHIVNTASMAGLVGFPMVAPYSATKFAVVGLSEALSAELAVHNIGVSAICPAAVRTGVLAHGRLRLPGGWGDRLGGLLDRHAADPDRVARAVLGAVRRDRALVAVGIESLWPWQLKRLSGPLYRAVARRVTRGIRARAAQAALPEPDER